jgi:alpha/beta superfamily hydrolase
VESLGADRAAEAERKGAASIPWGKETIQLKRAFFRSLAELNPMAAIAPYKGSVFIVAGSKDKLAKYVAPLHDAAAVSKRREQRIIDDADHFFGANERRSAHVETLLTATAEFFAAALAK